jgi:hypothetical protein
MKADELKLTEADLDTITARYVKLMPRDSDIQGRNPVTDYLIEAWCSMWIATEEWREKRAE